MTGTADKLDSIDLSDKFPWSERSNNVYASFDKRGPIRPQLLAEIFH